MDDINQRFRRLYMDPNYRGADGFTKDEDIMLLSLVINIGTDYDRIAALMNHTPTAVRHRFLDLELLAHHPLGWILWTPTRIQLPAPQTQERGTQEEQPENNNNNGNNNTDNNRTNSD